MAAPSSVTDLQIKVTELCQTYFTAIGHLQNTAPPAPLEEDRATRDARVGALQPLVDELAGNIVRTHHEIEGLIDELSRLPCSEEDELRRLDEVQAEHAEVTETLRLQTARTGAAQHAATRRALRLPIAPLPRTEQIATSVGGSLKSLLESMPRT